MNIEKDNFLNNYNLVKIISNNITIKAIQKELNYLDFKIILEEYKNI